VSKLRYLDPLKRRDYLASPKSTPEGLSAYGRQFFEEEDYYGAFHFFNRAGDKDGLIECARAAIEGADHELLWQLDHSEHMEITELDWRACAAKAIELGKITVAAYALARIGDTASLEALPREDAEAPPEPS